MSSTLFLLWSFVVAIVLIIANGYYKWKKWRKPIDLIPGPPSTPVIGNLREILLPPDALWTNLRRLNKEYHPIYKLWCGFLANVVISSPEDVEILIASMNNLEKSRMYECLHKWLGTGLLTSTGNKWQLRRKLLTPTFHFNILRQFIAVFAEQSEVLLEQLRKESAKPYIDIVPYITKFTLHSICETAMGTQLESLTEKPEEYRQAIYRMGDLAIYRLTRPWFYYTATYFFSKAFWEEKILAKKLHSFSLNVIRNRWSSVQTKGAQKETEEPDDVVYGKKRLAMLDLLIAARKSGESIDEEGIREEVDAFMFEGHDTTTVSICFTLMLLACHRDIQEKVVMELKEVLGDKKDVPSYQELQELKYLEMVLKESLRLYPSVPWIGRITSEDVHTHSGYIIPAGSLVNIAVYDIHHNPDYYPEPEKFDPDRFLPENTQNRHPFVYIPFSAGPRNCIGQKFAYLELKVVLAKILMNFILHPVDKPENISLMVDLITRTTQGVRIKLEPRNK